MTVANIEPNGLESKIKFAQTLAGSSLLPQAFRQQPANILVALEYGTALGIAPIVAISEINVINGTPSLSASLMQSLARQAGHKVRTVGDDKSATCIIVRKDDPSFEHTVTWDEAKAKANGLWGKGHWAKNPGLMLKWRAVAECVRMACSEVLGGIKYTEDEVRDFQPTTHTVTASVPPVAAPKPPSIREAVAEAQAVEQVWKDEHVLRPAAVQTDEARARLDSLNEGPMAHPPVTAPADQPVPMITQAQLKMLHALLPQVGLEDRADALNFMTHVTFKTVTSSKDLTLRDAGKVIDALVKAKEDGVNLTTGEVTVQAEIVEDWPTVAGVQS